MVQEIQATEQQTRAQLEELEEEIFEEGRRAAEVAQLEAFENFEQERRAADRWVEEHRQEVERLRLPSPGIYLVCVVM